MQKTIMRSMLGLILFTQSIPITLYAQSVNQVNNPKTNILISEKIDDKITDTTLEYIEETPNEVSVESNDVSVSTNKKTNSTELLIAESEENSSLTINQIDDRLEYQETNDNEIIYENERDAYSSEINLMDGGVQVNYNIESEDSPNEYILNLGLEEGSIINQENGEYFIENQDGEVEYFIGPAWAVDSQGNLVDTHYEVEGNNLVQVIDYEGDNYPIEADPLFCSDTIDNKKTTWRAPTLSVYARTCSKKYITSTWAIGYGMIGFFGNTRIAKDMWSEVTRDSSYKQVQNKYRARIKDQFICHAINPTTIWKSSWNLDTNRPDVSLGQTYLKRCNPKY